MKWLAWACNVPEMIDRLSAHKYAAPFAESVHLQQAHVAPSFFVNNALLQHHTERLEAMRGGCAIKESTVQQK